MTTILYAKSLCPEFILSEYGVIGKFILETREELNIKLTLSTNLILNYLEVLQKDETLAIIVPEYVLDSSDSTSITSNTIKVTLIADNIISKKKLRIIENALKIAQTYKETLGHKGKKHYSHIGNDIPAAVLSHFVSTILGVTLEDTITTVTTIVM